MAEPDSAAAVVEAHGPFEILVNNAGTDDFAFFTEMTPERWRAPDRDQPGGRVRVHPRRASGDAAGRLRADRQHRVRGGAGGLEGLGRLFGRQGRRDRVHEDDRPRERPLRDHRERDRARADQHPAPDGAPRSWASVGERIIETMREATQMRRLGEPEEVAAAVAFLASDDASFVTGETLGVSGGLGMV